MAGDIDNFSHRVTDSGMVTERCRSLGTNEGIDLSEIFGKEAFEPKEAGVHGGVYAIGFCILAVVAIFLMGLWVGAVLL